MEKINLKKFLNFTQDSQDSPYIEMFSYVGFMCETSDYSWEAMIFSDDDGEAFFDNIHIVFNDKRTNNEYDWDEMEFFRGILQDDPESIAELRSFVDKEGEIVFKNFLSRIKESC